MSGSVQPPRAPTDGPAGVIDPWTCPFCALHCDGLALTLRVREAKALPFGLLRVLRV